jgi:hypothetical protein
MVRSFDLQEEFDFGSHSGGCFLLAFLHLIIYIQFTVFFSTGYERDSFGPERMLDNIIRNLVANTKRPPPRAPSL